jgi:hypothetical protein
MARKSPRYLGMTNSQISILAGLAAIVVLAICAMFWMIFSTAFQAEPLAPNGQTGLSNQGQTTSTLAVTITTTPSVTLEPSATVTPPATIVPPGDWAMFETRGAQIWLPNSFVGGDMTDQRAKTIQKVNKLGKYYKLIVEDMKAAPEDYVMWMLDTGWDKSVIVSTVIVHHQVLTVDTKLEKYIQDELAKLNETPTINKNKKMTVLGYETRQLVFQALLGTLEFTCVNYFIKDEADFWRVDYCVAPERYYELYPLIENSMKTFYLVK